MLRTAAIENPFEPGIDPPTVGAFLDNRLVGFVTTIPTQFWQGEKYAAAHWVKALCVLEEHRNGPIAMLLMKGILKHIDVAASMPASPMARELSVALGMLDLGAVRDYIAPLRPTRILRKLEYRRFEHLSRLPRAVWLAIEVAKIPPLAYAIGGAISLGLTVLRLRNALAGRELTTKLATRLPSEATLDSLWARARSASGCSPTRSGAYLLWRYERGGEGHYSFAAAWCGDDLMGIAVLAPPRRVDDSRIAGLGLGSVVDLLLDPNCPAALPSLLGIARGWARVANYDALLLTASQLRLRGPLRRSGYFQVPGNIHLMLRDSGGKRGLSTDLDTWTVTRGDAWGDHL